MKTTVCSLSLAFAMGLALTPPFATAGTETIQRTVRGTVVATNTAADPPTIVLQVLLPNKEELIVGARVPADTKISRGKKAAGLADIKTGEAADMTYLKSPDGLTAQSIHVR